MMLLLGWTRNQFAIAKDYYTMLTGDNPSTDVQGAYAVYDCWKSRRLDEPGEIQIFGVEPLKDIPWANRTFHVVAVTQPLSQNQSQVETVSLPEPPLSP